MITGIAAPANKQLLRTVIRRRGDGASAPFHYALAPRLTPQRAAAQLRRYAAAMRFVFLLLLSLTQPAWAADADIQRFDDRNMRVFVVVSPSLVDDDGALVRLMEDVAAGIAEQRPAWAADWSVSLFAAAHLVGYKDEAHVAKYVASGEWAEGYLGEYSHETRSIVLHPLTPEFRREHVLQ